MLEFLVPGQLIVNPEHPEWGTGQVQSVVENKVTANFEECGKVVIDSNIVPLILASEYTT